MKGDAWFVRRVVTMANSRAYRASRPSRSGISEYRFTNRQGAGDQRGWAAALGEGLLSTEKRSEPGSDIVDFLRCLTAGIQVVLQYDCQHPAFGIYQGLDDGFVLLTNYNGFPGLVRLDAKRVNAVSVF